MTQESAPQARTVVRLGNPGSLLASLPALLGFAPRQSLILIGVHHDEGRSRLGALVRTDLPTNPEQERAVARAMRDRISQTGAHAVHPVVVAESEGAAGPRRGLIDTISDAFTATGIEVAVATWAPEITAGAVWCCYDGCCSGALPDPGATEVAAHQAVAGTVTYRSREEAAAALGPDPAAASARRRYQLDAAHDEARHARARDRLQAARGDLAAIRDAAGMVGRGETLDDDRLVRLVAALTDPAVRDVCLGFALGCDDAVRPEQAHQLWWLLTRAAPAPEAAEPAVLLACAAIEMGGGVTASIALERANAADPEHRLSGLLRAAFDHGFDPTSLRQFITEAATESADRLA